MTIEEIYKRAKTTIFRAGSPEESKKAVHGINDLMKQSGCSGQDRANVWGTLFSEDVPLYESEGLITGDQALAIRTGIHEVAQQDKDGSTK